MPIVINSTVFRKYRLLNKVSLLFHTVRYLKPIQIYWRLYFRLYRKHTHNKCIQSLTTNDFKLVEVNSRPVSFDGCHFVFLNHSLEFTTTVNWNDLRRSKLWLYNLHYFDYIQQQDIEQQACINIIFQWVEDNPAFDGNGWEPYPLSLRIVNWIKFLQRVKVDDTTSRHILDSLYLQVRSLRRQLEFHLLGNHLFKNAVALLFAGYFFSGREAHEWYKKGKAILLDQLKEQVLADGGHYERSPMYHALILEDILDCLNLVKSNRHMGDHAFVDLLETKACAMLSFIEDIAHPDQTLPTFNDTSQGISSTLEQLTSYAQRLHLKWQKELSPLIEKSEFGLFILKNDQIHCIIDAGKIGPDYLPGHAHCDTLSYELSIKGYRVVVNAGVFQYAGEERNLYRATRSHNTVEIDHAEQHEIWSTFRVARRGYPCNVSVKCSNDELFFSGQHTGYQRLKGKPIHQRDIRVADKTMSVVDRVLGNGEHSAKSFIHLHPDVVIIESMRDQLTLGIKGSVFSLRIPDNSDWFVRDYEYSPEFGLKKKSKIVTISSKGACEISISYCFEVN